MLRLQVLTLEVSTETQVKKPLPIFPSQQLLGIVIVYTLKGTATFS
jgi:hypothetical protein